MHALDFDNDYARWMEEQEREWYAEQDAELEREERERLELEAEIFDLQLNGYGE